MVSCRSAAGAGMTAWAALTFAVFSVGFPVLCSWLLWNGQERTPLAACVEFMLEPLRLTW
jgi:hypothetical protein